MNISRNVLATKISNRFQIIYGSPPAAAVRHRNAVLQLFLRHGRSVLLRWVLLRQRANGDWRSPYVQHYVPASPASSVDETPFGW